MNSKRKWALIIMLLSGVSSFLLTYFYVNDKLEMASKTFRITSLILLLILAISLIYYLISTRTELYKD